MTKKPPVTYRLEGKIYEAGLWIPLQAKPYQGPGARSTAMKAGEELSAWSSYAALRVMKSGESKAVWEWTRPTT